MRTPERAVAPRRTVPSVTITAKAQELLRLHTDPELLVVVNVWDVISATVVADQGSTALATASHSIAATLGYPDGEKIPRDLMIDMVGRIAAAVDIPVTADLESGYGDRPEDVAETVRLAAEAGAVGASVEDTTGDPGDPVRPLAEAVERAAAAVAAARSLPFPFTLTLRADNFFAGRPDLDDTVARLVAFEAAGADVLYAPGIRDVAAVRRVLDAVSAPVNVLAVPAPGFSVRELSALGVRRVSVGSALSRVALAAVLDAATELRERGTVEFAAKAPTYAALNALLAAPPG
jgi:2-methylisocitrate lyase-like PEP mutase family enzyme